MPSRNVRRMKQKLRNERVEEAGKRWHHKPVIWTISLIILIVIVVTFIGGPLAGKLGASGQVIFGKYGSEVIDLRPGNYLTRQRNLIAEQLGGEYGDQTSFDLVVYQIWKGAFERTVIHTAILHDFNESGMHITESRVDLALTSYPGYLTNGVFDEDKYRQTSNIEKHSNRDLVEEELIHSQYTSDVLASQKVSSHELEFIKSMGTPERKFRYVTISMDAYPNDRLTDYGETHAKLFQKISISRILIRSSAEDAQNLRNQIEADQAIFGELAGAHSQDAFANSGGEMGELWYHELRADFANLGDLDNLFSLPDGTISEVLPMSGDSWAIFRIDSSSSPIDLKSSEDLEEALSYMKRYEKGMLEDYLIEEGYRFSTTAFSTSFEAASVSLERPYFSTGFFPINYGNLSFRNNPFMKQIADEAGNPILPGASSNLAFFKRAFSIKPGEVSEPLILNNEAVILQLIEERDVPEDELSLLELFYPYASQQWKEQQLVDLFLHSDQLEDNFNAAFSRLYPAN